jgi:hypothetical protein
MTDWLINWKIFGRKRSSLRSTVPAFVVAVSSGVLDKGRTKHLPNTSLRRLFTVFLVSWGGMRLTWVRLVRRPLTGLLHQSQMIDDDECGRVGGMRIGRGNRSTRRETCANVTLSTIYPTWRYLVSNPGRRRGKLATNRLIYGTDTPVHSVRAFTCVCVHMKPKASTRVPLAQPTCTLSRSPAYLHSLQ